MGNLRIPKILSTQMVAKLLNVHPETVRRWDRAKKLVSVRVGNRGHRRYQRSEILKILNHQGK